MENEARLYFSHASQIKMLNLWCQRVKIDINMKMNKILALSGCFIIFGFIIYYIYILYYFWMFYNITYHTNVSNVLHLIKKLKFSLY